MTRNAGDNVKLNYMKNYIAFIVLILLYSSSISAFDPFLLYTKLTEYSVNEPVLESIVVGCTVQTNELLLAGKVYFVQMVLDDLSMTAVLTQPSKSWVGPHLALNQSLNL